MSRYRTIRYTHVCDNHTSFKTHRTENSLSYEKETSGGGTALPAVPSLATHISVSFRLATGLGFPRGHSQQTCSHARARATEASGIDDNPQQIGIKELISFRGRREYPMRRDTRRVGQ